jgi:hypothetical protein
MKAILTFAFALAVVASADAQQLKIAFNQGHVSLDANTVPARTILAEWAKAGGTKVTGADRMTGAPLTLKLVDVPEAQALEIILRSAAGYMAAPRLLAATGSSSIYDRILVMATTSGTAAPAASTRPTPAANVPGPNAGLQRFIPPRVSQAEPDDDPAPDEQPPSPNQPVFTFPQPGQNGFPQVGYGPQGGQVIQIDPRTGQPQTITINPTAPPAAAPAAPTSIFGSPSGAPTPGMIQQPPPTQQVPGQVTRPPGVVK